MRATDADLGTRAAAVPICGVQRPHLHVDPNRALNRVHIVRADTAQRGAVISGEARGAPILPRRGSTHMGCRSGAWEPGRPIAGASSFSNSHTGPEVAAGPCSVSPRLMVGVVASFWHALIGLRLYGAEDVAVNSVRADPVPHAILDQHGAHGRLQPGEVKRDARFLG
jgi:hypothetical protein